MSEQQQRISIPKRFQAPIKDIFFLQQCLQRREGKNAYKQLNHPKFRAGYDFLLLRGQIEGGETLELANWWTHFQEATAETQTIMLKALRSGKPGNRRPHRKRRRKANANSTASTKAQD